MGNTINRRSALESVYKTGRLGADSGITGIHISERTGLTIVHVEVAIDDDESAQSLEVLLGTSLPSPGQSVDSSDYRLICSGPGRWLLVSPGNTHGETENRLGVAIGVAVNNVSSSRCVVRLSGAHVRDVLAADCKIDLHPSVFSPGSSATTDIDHVVVILDCIDEDTFDVYVPRGFAVSFWEWLMEAAAEYGGEIRAN